jgi:hypothetical protein
MVVDRGEIYAGFVSYLPERSAGKALLAKQSFGGVKDAITGGWRFCRHRNDHLKQTFECIDVKR